MLNPNFPSSGKISPKNEILISLLPLYPSPKILLSGDGLPCLGAKIQRKPVNDILREIKRQVWTEGLYVRQRDLNKIIRYKNAEGHYKNDFDHNQFLEWVKIIENNTALCNMANHVIGKGIFVPPRKKLPRGTFIPSSGIIKLNPTINELETKIHCSALQNLNSPNKKIMGIINPKKRGGILNFINHAPEKDELKNFIFKKPINEYIATANLKSTIKFYNGYAIMGVEAFEDISGGKYGIQLLWSYARSCEYLIKDQSSSTGKNLFLFDNRPNHQGEILDTNKYGLRIITIFFDTGELILRKVATLTRWELMESSPESGLVISPEDPYSIIPSKPVQSLIPHKLLQTYLRQNPEADRIVIRIPILKAQPQKDDKNDSDY